MSSNTSPLSDSDPVGLIDLDGSVADFDKAMRTQLEALRSPDEDPTLDETAYEDVKHIKARRRLIKSQPGFWRNLEPLPLGFQVVEEMRRLRYRLHVLSKGPIRVPAAWAEKIEWCGRHLADVQITLSEDKGLVYGRVLLDDWPEYIEAWLAHRTRGFVIAVAQPWNVRIERQFPGRVLRYDGHNFDVMSARLTAIREDYRAQHRLASSTE